MQNNYYKGLVEGLSVGIEIIKEVLESGGVSQDDLLESYNKMVNEATNAYSKSLDVDPQGNLFGEALQYNQLGGTQ